MPVPTDPVQLVLLALVLWGFWAACVRRDLIAQRRAKTGRFAGAVPDSSTPPPRGDPKRRTFEGGDRG